jgi:hypothetical protein
MGRRGRTAAVILAACVALLAYGSLLFWHASFAVGGSDSSGYANTARMIAGGRIVEPVDAVKQLGLTDDFTRIFIPLAFEPGPRPRTMVPFYPPGYPLMMALAGLAAGWNYGPFIVSPIAALVSLLLIYLAGRELGLSRVFSAAGGVILALCPIFLFLAEQPMSDSAATMWALAAVVCALRSRKRKGWAAAAGAAFAMAVLVRPTNLLLLVPLLLTLRWRARTLGLFVLCGLPFALLFFAWNRAAFGGFLRTGYSGLVGGAFAAGNLLERIRHYAYWLARMVSPLLPIFWLAIALDRRAARSNRAMLVAWFGLFLLLYCFWGPYEAWWYTRFLLPALPAVILAALLVMRDLRGPLFGEGRRHSRFWAPVAFVLFLVVLGFEYRFLRQFDVLRLAEGETVYPDASRWVESKLPPQSLVLSMQMSGALKYYTSLTPVRWDWIQPEQVTLLRENARARGYRWFALLFPFENEELEKRLPWGWTRVGTLRNVTLWQAEPGP